MTKANNQRDIQLFVTSFNEAWIQGKIHLLNSLLHEKAVFLAPDLKTEFSGRKACLKTIEDYNRMAVTESFDVTNINIKRWGNVAITKLDYCVAYTLNNISFKEKGKEMWTLVSRKSGKWQMIHRAILNNESI